MLMPEYYMPINYNDTNDCGLGYGVSFNGWTIFDYNGADMYTDVYRLPVWGQLTSNYYRNIDHQYYDSYPNSMILL